MSGAYRLTPRAVADLEDIADYTLAEWGPDQMETYLRSLDSRFEWLSKYLLLGRLRTEIAPNVRSYREGSHLIFYQVNEGVIDIIGVPHQSMDIDAYFQ